MSYDGLANSIGNDSGLRPISISLPNVESLGFIYDTTNWIIHITNSVGVTLSQTLGYGWMTWPPRATFLPRPGNNTRQHGIAPKTLSSVHVGQQYHEFILASQLARRVRDRFQKMALDLLPAGADVLDYGAGTGIDAKVYAANGHLTFVYEPSEAMYSYLTQYCRDEIERKTVIAVAPPLTHRVQAITANFAVLNHFEDHTSLFDELSQVVGLGGFVLASMLNPYYLGDARYKWWRANVVNLIRNGRYPIPSASNIHRFAPRVVARAAAPYFRLERLVPRGFGLAAHLYMFLLFRRV